MNSKLQYGPELRLEKADLRFELAGAAFLEPHLTLQVRRRLGLRTLSDAEPPTFVKESIDQCVARPFSEKKGNPGFRAQLKCAWPSWEWVSKKLHFICLLEITDFRSHKYLGGENPTPELKASLAREHFPPECSAAHLSRRDDAVRHLFAQVRDLQNAEGACSRVGSEETRLGM